jgi:hypothetical protein
MVIALVSVVLGALCVTTGAALCFGEAARRQGTRLPATRELTDVGKAVARVLRTVGTVRAGVGLVVVGLVLFTVGRWLVTTEPF